MLLTVGGLGMGAVIVMGMMAQRITSAVTERPEVVTPRIRGRSACDAEIDRG